MFSYYALLNCQMPKKILLNIVRRENEVAKSNPAPAAAPAPAPKIRLKIVNRCIICMTNYDNKKVKKIKCESCYYEACMTCYESYILTQKFAKCMSIYCKLEWSAEFISKTFSEDFIEGEYKRHHQNILLENEKASFPETVECIKRLDEIETALEPYGDPIEIVKKSTHDMLMNDKTQREIASTRNMIYVLEEEIKKNCAEKNCDENNESEKRKKENIERLSSLQKYKQQLEELYIKHNQLNENIYQYNRDIEYIDRLLKEKNNIERTGKISGTIYNAKKCPVEECRGFLDAQFMCGICKIAACKSCHEVKNEEHKCNPDTVKTIDLMTKDTKACPSCHTNINKIDGCDQMWCTLCHTAFSWTTGLIEKKIHNPHYYQWLRSKSPDGQIPREQEDVDLCDRYIDSFINNSLQKFNNYVNTEYQYNLSHIGYILYTLRDIYIPKMEKIERKNVKSCFMKKCAYLKNDLTEKKYKIFLEKNEIKRKVHDRLKNMLTMFLNMYLDILHTIIKIGRDTKDDHTRFEAMEKYISPSSLYMLEQAFNNNIMDLKSNHESLYTSVYSSIVAI